MIGKETIKKRKENNFHTLHKFTNNESPVDKITVGQLP